MRPAGFVSLLAAPPLSASRPSITVDQKLCAFCEKKPVPASTAGTLLESTITPSGRIRYFLKLPSHRYVEPGRNTEMYKSFRFCVRLNAFTATVGDVNDVESLLIDSMSRC